MVPEARRITSRPTSVDPVKATLATSGCSTSRVPTTDPLPATTCSTPSGMPASRASSASRSADERGDLGRLDHDGVAGGQGRADLPRGDGDREVPRDDGGHHAERLVEGHVHATGHRHRGPPVLVHRTGVEVEHLGHHGHLVAAVGDGLAHVGRLQLGQLLAVLLDLGGEPSQRAGPGRPGPRPARPDRRPAPGPRRRRSPPPRRGATRRWPSRWPGSPRWWCHARSSADSCGRRVVRRIGAPAAGRGHQGLEQADVAGSPRDATARRPRTGGRAARPPRPPRPRSGPSPPGRHPAGRRPGGGCTGPRPGPRTGRGPCSPPR